jgi:hypothetical protein
MFGLVASLMPFGRPHARHALRTCPVCQTGVEDEDRYVSVRGMRIHGGCAGYRSRRLGMSARVGRMAG